MLIKMPDSIPQWVTDIESDETIFKKKSNWWRAGILSIICVYFIVGFLLLQYYRTYFNPFFVAIFVAVVILFYYRLGIKKPDLPNLLSANLYRIGKELETFNAGSPSYIKRNQQYLKTSQNLTNKLIINDNYFIQNYNNFFKNLENIILRLNYFYLKNSKPNNVFSISDDLKALATALHENQENLEPLHTAYVNGILSNLHDVEPKELNLPVFNRLYNSFNTNWYNVSYSSRAAITFLIIGISISGALSIGMIYFLNMGKSESIGYALVGTLTFLGGLITQIDKIVPREKK